MAHVQYGCGLCAPARWMNFDVSPTLRVQRVPLVGRLTAKVGPRFPANVRYGDIRSGLPIPDNQADAMYCSHVLEHLALEDFRRALRHTHRHLKPGGVFRFVLPDLEWIAREYLRSGEKQPACWFMGTSFLGKRARSHTIVGRLRQVIGNSDHLWMWDYRSIVPELEAAGFREIRRATPGDSSDSLMHEVECPGRWENALGVECRK